jgi:hypothetical protein
VTDVEPTLDHLVQAVPDLDDAVAEIARATGVRPVEGGRHAGHGTRNYLVGLGGSRYLEVVGPDPDQPPPTGPRWFGIDALTAPRLVTWAVRPSDLDAVVARARSLGLDPGEPLAMSRRTPGGDELRWRLTAPGVDRTAAVPALLPFLIDWGATPHPTAADLPRLELLDLSAEHPDPEAVRHGLQALGVQLPVRRGPAARLRAALRGPHGDFVPGQG